MTHRRPNIIFVMSDDHAAHAMSCYGSRVNQTPNLDRLANEGVRLDNCHCTNSICAPSRAVILTGLYSHRPGNGVLTLDDKFDGRQRNVAKLLQAGGYQTALFGKWHLGHGGHHDPTGFDDWAVLPGQGDYHDPTFLTPLGKVQRHGYVTDLITDDCLGWLEQRDPSRPFFLMYHHKAPHRPWLPDAKHASLYEEIDLPLPPSFDDDHSGQATAAKVARMTIEHDLNATDLKQEPPAGLSGRELAIWKYQRYLKDYLRCVASIDDNVGRLLDYLDAAGLREDTLVIYTSDQGFFLGDHGWYDKRFMYEESLRMPFVARYPREIPAGSSAAAICLNVDFAQTFLDYAGLPDPGDLDGCSLRAVLAGTAPDDWRSSLYYRYYMHLAHHYVYSHYGVRTARHKLSHYYEPEPGPREWELFDLHEDPLELRSVYDDPAYAAVRAALKAELQRLRASLDDQQNPPLD
ncbi:MAG: sulfatase [Fimbriimonadaceae bacterium]|nr:sulfatase [Fimbriimonadaceae bacterium]